MKTTDFIQLPEDTGYLHTGSHLVEFRVEGLLHHRRFVF